MRGEGSSGDSIVNLSENRIQVNRRCFLPPLSSQKPISSRILALKKINYLTEISQAEE
jgi:hypothetical protein